MDELYLEVMEVRQDTVLAPLETAICLATLHYLGYPSTLKVNLLSFQSSETSIPVKTSGLNFSYLGSEKLSEMATFCHYPMLVCCDGISCVAGLCAVLRKVIKISGDQWENLLGFREGCLVATAEFSMWTKFCEVDLINCCKLVLREKNIKLIPEELAQLEVHMSQPIRAHNIGKLKSTDHTFVEGSTFLLSDIIISIPVFIIVSVLNCWRNNLLKLTLNWLSIIQTEFGLQEALSILDIPNVVTEPQIYDFPLVKNHSLYKTDPKRYKPRHKIFNQQCDIDDGFRKLSSVRMKEYEEPIGNNIKMIIENNLLPDVPKDRLERKIQQLLNLARSVLQVSRNKDIIVDFCSGSGHLGLILAHFLPKCMILLLDNKERSLNRAKEKLKSLQISNIFIIQSNLDYFRANFQVGVALHACGVASDLVIQKCLNVRANFIICPCCYGNIQVNHVVQYPQSIEFREAGLSPKGFIVLGHCADQEGTEQGERGMLAVDTDRCLAAEEVGYQVTLAKLIPPTCTPRNNLIVAFLPNVNVIDS